MNPTINIVGSKMTAEIKWTRAEAMACALCWAEFSTPETRPDTPEQYWLHISERSRQECRKLVKDRYLLAVASRQAAPLFPPSNIPEAKMEAVREAMGLKARHRVWQILQAIHRTFLPPEWSDADRAEVRQSMEIVETRRHKPPTGFSGVV